MGEWLPPFSRQSLVLPGGSGGTFLSLSSGFQLLKGCSLVLPSPLKVLMVSALVRSLIDNLPEPLEALIAVFLQIFVCPEETQLPTEGRNSFGILDGLGNVNTLLQWQLGNTQ